MLPARHVPRPRDEQAMAARPPMLAAASLLARGMFTFDWDHVKAALLAVFILWLVSAPVYAVARDAVGFLRDDSGDASTPRPKSQNLP